MDSINLLKNESVLYVINILLFVVEWLQFYIKWLTWSTAIHATLTFLIFIFLDTYRYLKPNISKKEESILLRLLNFTQVISLGTIFLTFLLLVILSILEVIHKVLITLYFCEILFFLIFDLQMIFLKFFVKTWIWVFIYIKVYKFFSKVFFEFKRPLDSFGKFLLEIFPIITIFIIFIILSLMYCLAVIVYL